MILLDTNVISETFRPHPEPKVAKWLSSVPIEDLFVSSITTAELLYGMAILPDGRRKLELANVIERFLTEKIVNPIQSFDAHDASAYARISAHRHRIGRVVRELDAQIAAIAQTRSLTIATRNVSDFEDCGVEIINPWEA
ncbi:type II toxin-antitoxin system VapC family toxin [Aquamicrobium sp. LC103]|uniref:type II toxin-antitoxin system VapC family toxin n=1 Tax=Aquamicrobium sp. LC103 TaxID=1120658 RepID=UPI00063E9A92|nr:type II toxin-antitoxin system VapC family toxin [Aquamicrobium sp. LC103]TKT82570.1 type II toxin-antitoxin system VapC family toxin [Aquamicrobium sp. LC103]